MRKLLEPRGESPSELPVERIAASNQRWGAMVSGSTALWLSVTTSGALFPLGSISTKPTAIPMHTIAARRIAKSSRRRFGLFCSMVLHPLMNQTAPTGKRSAFRRPAEADCRASWRHPVYRTTGSRYDFYHRGRYAMQILP